MKKLLTCDINRRMYMSYASRQRCPEGPAAQSGSHPSPRACATARGRRTPRPRLGHLQAPSLSLSPSGTEAQTTRSGGGCQSFFYGQAFTASGGNAPQVCRLDWTNPERDRQPSIAEDLAPWGRSWLTARQDGNVGCGWNINLIGWGRRDWPRLMNAWCPTRSGPEVGPLSRRQPSTRRI